MRFGPRRPSWKKKLAARGNPKRYLRHTLGIKKPRGWGWTTSPRRALYNSVYSRTTRKSCVVVIALVLLGSRAVWALVDAALH